MFSQASLRASAEILVRGPPPVYQYLSTRHDWPVVIVDLQLSQVEGKFQKLIPLSVKSTGGPEEGCRRFSLRRHYWSGVEKVCDAGKVQYAQCVKKKESV